VIAHHGNELNEHVGIQLASMLRDQANYFEGQTAQEPYECHQDSMSLDGRTWRHAADAQGVQAGLWEPNTDFDKPLPIWIVAKAVRLMPWLLKGIMRNTTAIAATGSSEGFAHFTIQLPTRFSLSKPQTLVGGAGASGTSASSGT